MAQQRSYPNISFKETIIGPSPTTRPWRDTIGVVGEFPRGPLTPVTVASRQEAVEVFGEDVFPASLGIQDAMQIGASNFTIARAIPVTVGAKAQFQISAGNPDLEPVTAYESTDGSTASLPDQTNYTIGMGLEFNYVSSPVVAKSLYDTVHTQATRINHTKFSGRANLRQHVVHYVDAGDRTNPVSPALSSIKVSVSASDNGDYQYVVFDRADGTDHDITDLDEYIRPGYVLKNGTKELLIVSKPLNFSDTQWGLLVQNVGVTLTAANETGWQVFFPAVGNYILGYALELVDMISLTPYTTGQGYFNIASETYVDRNGNSYPIDAYKVLPVNGGGTFQNFTYLTVPGGSATGPVTLGEEHFGAGASEGIRIRFGSANQANVALEKGGQFSVSFAKATAMVGAAEADATGAYPIGTPATTILRALETAVARDGVINSLVEDAEAGLLVPPYTFALKSKIKGTEANRINYKVTRYTVGTANLATDLLLKKSGDTSAAAANYGTYETFTDGFDGATFASRDFYALNGRPVVRVVAVSPGSAGNQIKLTIQPSQVNEPSTVSFDLIAEFEGTTEILTLNTGQVGANGLFLQSRSSTLVRAYFLPVIEAPSTNFPADVYLLQPLRQAPPLGLQSGLFDSGATAVAAQAGRFIRDVYLRGAFDYFPSDLNSVEARKLGFMEALKKIENEDIAFLTLPGLVYGDTRYQEVFAEAKAQVERSNAENGLRIALFDAPPGVPERQAANLAASLNSERVKLIAGHSVSIALNGNTYPRVPSSLKAAGLMAIRPPRISPASTYGGYVVPNVIAVDTKNDSKYLEAMTRGHVEVLFYDSGIRAHKFLNGVTTSSDPSRRYDSVRRLLDQLISDLYLSLQWVRSEPNTRELQRRVSAAVDARLQTALRNGDLIRTAGAVCNEQNNTEADMIAGRLNIAIRVTPVFPADFINVGLVRDLTENFSVQTASNSISGF